MKRGTCEAERSVDRGGARPCIGYSCRRVTLALLAACCALPASAAATSGATIPRFIEVAAAAGVSHTYGGGWTYFVGGGVATLDCDHDGDTDLFFAGGADPSALFRNESTGRLAFSPVDSPSVQIDSVTGAYPLDLDADGLMDLAVLRAGENMLLRGRGNCAFEDRQCRIRIRRRQRLDDRVQRHLGRQEPAADARLR